MSVPLRAISYATIISPYYSLGILTTSGSIAVKARAIIIDKTHLIVKAVCSTLSATTINVSLVLITNAIRARGLN